MSKPAFADFYRATFTEMTRLAFLLTGSIETATTWCRTHSSGCTGAGTGLPSPVPTCDGRS